MINIITTSIAQFIKRQNVYWNVCLYIEKRKDEDYDEEVEEGLIEEVRLVYKNISFYLCSADFFKEVCIGTTFFRMMAVILIEGILSSCTDLDFGPSRRGSVANFADDAFKGSNPINCGMLLMEKSLEN